MTRLFLWSEVPETVWCVEGVVSGPSPDPPVSRRRLLWIPVTVLTGGVRTGRGHQRTLIVSVLPVQYPVLVGRSRSQDIRGIILSPSSPHRYPKCLPGNGARLPQTTSTLHGSYTLGPRSGPQSVYRSSDQTPRVLPRPGSTGCPVSPPVAGSQNRKESPRPGLSSVVLPFPGGGFCCQGQERIFTFETSSLSRCHDVRVRVCVCKSVLCLCVLRL